jgi:hypothetical protein
MYSRIKYAYYALPTSSLLMDSSCTLPESRVVKQNDDLLAFEPLPIYIGITTPFELGQLEEARFWQMNTCLAHFAPYQSLFYPSQTAQM